MTLILPADARRTFYEVTASSLADVVQLLSAAEAGTCDWQTSYEYDGVTREGKPRGLRFTMLITIELPRWVGRDTAPQAEQREWDRFLRALREHEAGHERIARNAAPAIYRKLQDTRASDLPVTFEEEKARLQSQSDAYDAANDHGRRPAPGTIITVP